MVLHIQPEDDTTEHLPAYSCPCGPHRDTTQHNGTLRWAVVHTPHTTPPNQPQNNTTPRTT